MTGLSVAAKRPTPPGPRDLVESRTLPSLIMTKWSAELFARRNDLPAGRFISRISRSARSWVAPLSTVGLGGKTPAVRVSDCGAASPMAGGRLVDVAMGRAAESVRTAARKSIRWRNIALKMNGGGSGIRCRLARHAGLAAAYGKVEIAGERHASHGVVDDGKRLRADDEVQGPVFARLQVNTLESPKRADGYGHGGVFGSDV